MLMLVRTLLLSIALLALPMAGAARAPQPLLERAEAQGSVRVLVELAVPFVPEGVLDRGTRTDQRREIAAAQAAVAGSLAGASHGVRREYRSIPYLALTVGAAALRRLEASPFVPSVEEDRLHVPVLLESVPVVEADQAVAAGWDGFGQTVVVLDTGVDAAHPNFAGKIVAEACFTTDQDTGNPNNGDCPNGAGSQVGTGAGTYCTYSDDCFHGTHVAGIAAGAGPTPPGVAAGATVIPIQVFTPFSSPLQCGSDPTPCPRSYASDQIAALEEVYDNFRNSYTIASVNLSIGGTTYTTQSACDAANAATKAAIDNLRSVGIATVISSGNDGETAAISEPGCISTAVSVGATNDFNSRRIWSNQATFLSLWAPGQGVVAPLYQTTGTTNASGTSMAAPHVAGAWAVLRQAVPSASVSSLLATFQATGQPVAAESASTSSPRIAAALDSLLVDCDDGLDNDGDGLADGNDPGCIDAADTSERGTLPCDDGVDNDSDGWADAPDDPGCAGPSWAKEDPACQDGLDNDGDGAIDFDGGATIHGTAQTDPDPQCGTAYRNRERPNGGGGCGLGFELALLVPLLGRMRARRREAG